MAYYPRLRMMREKHDWTQAKVAHLLHISQPTYSDYETGKVNIPLCALCALATLYGTSTDYLLDLTNEPIPHPRTPHK